MKRAVLSLFVFIASFTFAVEPRSAFFTTSDGVRLHYIEAGKGPAIVFIPGWTMPATIWRPQIEHFSRKFHVIAIDPRSQGESAKPGYGNYSARRAQDYKELIEHLHLENVVLVGWSLAVHEEVTYAERFNNAHVRGYVLVDGFLWSKVDTDLVNSLAPWMMQIQSNRGAATAEFVKSMFKTPQSPQYLSALARASMKTPPDTAGVLIFNMLSVQDWRPAIQKMTVPVLYAYIPENQKTADLLKSQLPALGWERFDNAAHALFVDDPARFNHALEEFIKVLRQP